MVLDEVLVMLTVRVTSDGQIFLPKPVCEQFDLRAGTELAVNVEGQRIVMRKVARHGWREMRGAFKGPSLVKARARERREELRRDAKAP